MQLLGPGLFLVVRDPSFFAFEVDLADGGRGDVDELVVDLGDEECWVGQAETQA